MAKKTTGKKISVSDVNNAVSIATMSTDNITKLERAIKRLPDKERLKWYLDYRKMLLEEKKFEYQKSKDKNDNKKGESENDLQKKKMDLLDRAINHLGIIDTKK